MIWYACATPGSPSGGPKDTKAPVMDTLVSSKSMQTNFEKQRNIERECDLYH